MLKISENFEFSKEKFRKIPILKEFEWFEWFERFEWFGPSPIEPFNSGEERLQQLEQTLHQLRVKRASQVPQIAKFHWKVHLSRTTSEPLPHQLWILICE